VINPTWIRIVEQGKKMMH